MFEASLKARRIEQGQTIQGTIVAISPEVAFVDVGGKGEATIDVSELKDADGQLEVAVGERIEAVVVSTAGGLTLSRKLARGAATARSAGTTPQEGPRRTPPWSRPARPMPPPNAWSATPAWRTLR